MRLLRKAILFLAISCFLGCEKKSPSVDLFPVRDAILSVREGKGDLHEFNKRIIHKVLFGVFILEKNANVKAPSEWIRVKEFLKDPNRDANFTVKDPALISEYFEMGTKVVYDPDFEIMNFYLIDDEDNLDYVLYSIPLPLSSKDKVMALFSSKLDYLNCVQDYNSWLLGK